jgi:hypothetical protein
MNDSILTYLYYAAFNFIAVIIIGTYCLKRYRDPTMTTFGVGLTAVIFGILSAVGTGFLLVGGLVWLFVCLREKYNTNPRSVNDKYKDI